MLISRHMCNEGSRKHKVNRTMKLTSFKTTRRSKIKLSGSISRKKIFRESYSLIMTWCKHGSYPNKRSSRTMITLPLMRLRQTSSTLKRPSAHITYNWEWHLPTLIDIKTVLNKLYARTIIFLNILKPFSNPLLDLSGVLMETKDHITLIVEVGKSQC